MEQIDYQTISKIFFFSLFIIIFGYKLLYLSIKISVIIPTYNRGNMIENSIKAY